MSSIAFIDTEIEPNSRRILDIGSVRDDGSSFHKPSVTGLVQFLNGTQFICGHNILNHDLKYIGQAVNEAGITDAHIIDTLYLSPLLFPTKPYHALLKDDKLQTEETNNPVNDSIKAKDLFNDEVAAFRGINPSLQQIFYQLLHDKKEFQAFFRFIKYSPQPINLEELIRKHFANEICDNVDIAKIISLYPVELAYCLSLLNSFIEQKKKHSITPPWVLRNYPEVEQLMFRLRNKPCIPGCRYCDQALDVRLGLKRWFGFDSYRTYGGEPLQEKAVKAAVDNKSILAVFPTGGGKSITFQVPALMCGENTRALTVVISPLQSLMKDQVDNLESHGITDAVTINGLLDPIERAKAFERVEDGSASILYISPESLRSKTIERLILGRKVARFVIDEAHCFSSWGQDFRVDYLYIGDFIRQIQEKKNMEEAIPVSCFTATAKQKVIEDIREYFKEKLSLELELYTAKVSRTNLQYKVFEKGDEEDKYQTLRNLIEMKKCPTIVYVSRTRKAYDLAEKLNKDGYNARPYHGKMDPKEKIENQNAFIAGEVQIMVATSAFGMGVDKKDVGMVIHYEISDSLENYIQEAGRAGRDEKLIPRADCFILFNEEDLGKHFLLLNQSKLDIKEIQQIWKAIKEITRFRSSVSSSALEIARKAGWDENVREIETRVTTAIAALEDAGYLRRGQNMPRVFANSILSQNAQEAIDKINASSKFEEKQKDKAIRIIKKLFSSKSIKHINDEVAESRIDYISDHLGIPKEQVIEIVTRLREEKILADAKDLTAFIKKGENRNKSLHIVESYRNLETILLNELETEEKIYHIKELNEAAELNGCTDASTNRIKTLINIWAIKGWIKRHHLENSKNHVAIATLFPKEELEGKMRKRHELAKFIVENLFAKSNTVNKDDDEGHDEVLVEFSVHGLKTDYEASQNLFKSEISVADIEDALFYLSRINAIEIEGGFLVSYNRLSIERIELDNYKKYTKDDYKKLNTFYEQKVQQIHIVGEYAKKMISDYKDALQFVEDYFQLNYSSFLRKYFPGSKGDELKLKITPGKFKQLFGELSPTQLKIINDRESKYIVVAAGPGSGKTRILVHKLASLLLMEDVKHEQLLMVTFSRAAATEFKKRLIKLIRGAANFIEIKTFHSYCFDLLGKVGSLEGSEMILKKAVERIKNKEVEASRITKTVLVIDEAQDMSADEFELIRALMDHNEDMRVIAVGDDDQNIYEFRGSNSKYMIDLIKSYGAAKYELVENYRSKSNLVDIANKFVQKIPNRLKEIPIIPINQEPGDIRIIRYQSKHLVTPLIEDILKAELFGTTCVLTKTNDEASQVTGLLLKNGVRAKLIQTNDGFNLYNLVEVRYFMDQLQLSDDVYTISDEIWDTAKRKLYNRYRNSSNFDLCVSIVKDFQETNPKKKYKSDLETFIRESKLEDFFQEDGETIFVSTIHKAKGREFDNVFILLDDFNLNTDEARRQLYVAMTRAKNSLAIHVNTNILDDIGTEKIEWLSDSNTYLPPRELAMHLTHEDVFLNHFNYVQRNLTGLTSGDPLLKNANGLCNGSNSQIVRFSKKFREKLQMQESLGFRVQKGRVNFIVYWKNEEMEKEIQIVLPEIILEKE